MKRSKILIFALILALLPISSSAEEGKVENKVEEKKEEEIKGITKIIAPPSVSLKQMKDWAGQSKYKADREFLRQAENFYNISVNTGIDPAVTYAQSAKETNFFRFTGVLTIDFLNPCGLKITAGGGDKDPDAHQRFESWNQGITAQVDHLALYAGQKGYPKVGTPDPRHFPSIKGRAPFVENLGANWAPSKTYGVEVVNSMKEMKKFPMATYTRIAGSDRFETAEKINERISSNSKVAVLASGISYPDALTANTLTKHTNGILYLQPASGISRELEKAIQAKKIDLVYIVGGEVAISKEVENNLKSRGLAVERISGKNRYKTAEKIAGLLGKTDTAILSSGDSFADTLSISPVAVKHKYPIYLTSRDHIDSGVLDLLARHKKIIIIGGNGAVSSSVENQIKRKGITVERISGSDRYDTSLKIAECFYPTAHSQTITSGLTFADSLAAVSLADRNAGGILLVNGKNLGKMTSYIRKSKPSALFSIGGTGVLSSNIDRELQNLANEK